MTDEEEKLERVGPFYRPKPKKLTPEQIAAKKNRLVLEKQMLSSKISNGQYDKYTTSIAKLLGMFGELGIKVANMYLWRFQLFNAAIVEGTGLLIYYALLPLFLVMFGNAYLAITLTVPISFLTKFVLYKMWMFKKVGEH